MNDIRDQLAEMLDGLKAMPIDPDVDSALRLMKAFLRIHDETTRAALVILAETIARK